MLPASIEAFPFGGATGERASRLDWASTPLGPLEFWPAALRHGFELCLGSPVITAVYWGPAFCMLYGDAYLPILAEKHAHALGRPAQHVWAERWPQLAPQLQHVMSTGQGLVLPHQRRELVRQGKRAICYFSYSFTPLRDEAGQVSGVFQMVQETTAEVLAQQARNQAQAALDLQAVESAQTRGLLQVLTDNTPDVIYVKDTAGRFVHSNNTVCRMFGRTRSEIIGRTDADFLPAEQAAAVMDNDHLVRTTRQTHTFEEEVQIVGDMGEPGEPGGVNDATPPARTGRPGMMGEVTIVGDSGSVNAAGAQHAGRPPRPPREPWLVTRLYLSTKSPWLAPDGTLLGMFGISRDITERKAEEDLLRQLNETLEEKVAQRTLERDRIWRVSREIFVVMGFEGRYVSVNPAFGRVLGWTFEEAVSMPAFALIHSADLAGAAREFEKVRSGERAGAVKCRMRHRNGSYRWLDWTAVAEDGLVYAVARDVTAEQTQAETLARAEEQLRQSQKMEAVGQLTGGIAHDFNNLLATIMSSLELLQRRAESGQLQDLQRYVAAARGSAQRAASLTQRLLAFSRRQALDPRPLDVNALVISMQELMHRTLGENVALSTALTADLPPAFTDANQLESALLNLAINARDAMPQGGTLTLKTAVEELDGGQTRAADELQPGPYVMVSVSDTGIGMTPEVKAKAFDPFFTTKPIGQGTGLGLSMIYGYVRQSGGHVAIDSLPGLGTSVRLYLPQQPIRLDGAIQPEPDRTPGATPPTPLGAGESILVVEDEAGVRMVVLEVLDELGYTTHEAVDATSALRLVDSGIPIDLLVTDVGLPGTNGRQLAEMVRARRPGLKVLFITGYTGHAAIRAEFLGQGMDMLTKPFVIDDLAQKIKAMLRPDNSAGELSASPFPPTRTTPLAP